MADDASSAGATNTAYSSASPSKVMSPMNSCERIDEEEQVEERLEETGEEDHPRPAIDHDVALDDQQAADRRPPGTSTRRACDELGHQTTSLRRYVMPREREARPSTNARCTPRWPRSPRARRPEREVAAQRHAVPQRREPRETRAERAARDREERPREEEHREDQEPEDRDERHLVLACAAQAAIGEENESPTRTVTGIASTPSGESTAPNAVITTR